MYKYILIIIFIISLTTKAIAVYESNNNKVRLKKAPPKWSTNVLDEQPIYYDDAKIFLDPAQNILRLRPGEFRNFTIRIYSDKPTVVDVRSRNNFLEIKRDKIELRNKEGSTTITALLIKKDHIDYVDFYIKGRFVASCKVIIENKSNIKQSSSFQFYDNDSKRISHSVSSNHDTWSWNARLEYSSNRDTDSVSGTISINW